MMNLANEIRGNQFLIIDGSQQGLSKVRFNLGQIADNKKIVSKDSTVAFYAVIPPKTADKNNNWSETELKEQVDTLTSIAEGFGASKVVYVDTDHFQSASKQTSAAKSTVRSEFDRMFSVNRAFTTEELSNAVGRRLWGENNNVGKKMNNLGAKILADPEKWGVFVADDSNDKAYEVACMYAKAAVALELVPSDITNFACISSKNFSAARSKLLEQEGVFLAYDESDKSQYAPHIAGGTFYMKSNDVHYAGTPNKVIGEYLTKKTYDEGRSKVEDHFSANITTNRWCRRWQEINVSEIVNTFSFGEISFPTYADEDVAKLPAWQEHVLRNIQVDDVEVDGVSISKLVQDAQAIFKIWKAYFFKATGLKVVFDELTSETIAQYEKLGKVIGVDAPVKAYISGVPLDDILA